MKNAFVVLFVSIWFFSGCASSPAKTGDPMLKESKAGVEEAVDAIAGKGKGVFVLTQPGNVTDPAEKAEKAPTVKEEPSLAVACPPGQLMATKIVTGETGTRITEECVTPFSSKVAKVFKKRARSRSIKLRRR